MPFSFYLSYSLAKSYGDIENAQYVRNYDGDTITFNLPDLHPIIGEKINIRVNGIDTPEIRGKCEKELGLFGDVHYTKEIPERTDRGEKASAHLQVKERVQETEINPMSHIEIRQILLEEGGVICKGCDREFDDPRYLELDHQLPKSEGGRNGIENRILLCSPMQ